MLDANRLPQRLSAIAFPGAPPLHRGDVARWLWPRLRRAFPDALAACILPNGVQLVHLGNEPRWMTRRLNRLMGQLGRRFSVRGRCADTWVQRPLTSNAAILQAIQQVIASPCREKLVDEPASWVFSTYRDLLGAVVSPWVSPARLANWVPISHLSTRALAGVNSKNTHHGLPPDRNALLLPAPAAATTEPRLTFLATAAAAATRQTPAQIRQRGSTRNIFVRLAILHGSGSHRQLAARCDCSLRTIFHILTRDIEDEVHAAQLCLEDPRLRSFENLPQPSAASTDSDRMPRSSSFGPTTRR